MKKSEKTREKRNTKYSKWNRSEERRVGKEC